MNTVGISSKKTCVRPERWSCDQHRRGALQLGREMWVRRGQPREGRLHPRPRILLEAGTRAPPVLPECRSPPPLATFPAHLADEGGVGEGGPDVCVLVELVILGQLWGETGRG